jgi:hypothetical protein
MTVISLTALFYICLIVGGWVLAVAMAALILTTAGVERFLHR